MTALTEKNNRAALIMACIVAVMVGLAFAASPFYRIFCAYTGFDGTPGRASRAPGLAAGQVNVRFDANVHPGLPWRFEPEQNVVQIKPGSSNKIFYRATNLSARTITAQAAYNVSPEETGKYFKKIQCFCFTEQTLKPGQSVEMPVTFFVDPKYMTDPDTKDIREITLSYTFYAVQTVNSTAG